jgi:hypothetical protein
MGNQAFETVREKGRQARRDGFPETACPYEDHRTHGGSVTFARGFIRAWLDGWRELDRAETASTK